MERLTDYSDDECTYIIGVGNKTCEEFCKYVVDGCRNCYIQQAFKKLADYEDLEEHGLLVRLPCKEAYSASGDMVYLIFEEEIVECVHCGLEICPVSGEGFISLATDEHIFPYRNPDPEHDLDPTDRCTNVTDASVNEIGKTLFFTREEAEKKLEEMIK